MSLLMDLIAMVSIWCTFITFFIYRVDRLESWLVHAVTFFLFWFFKCAELCRKIINFYLLDLITWNHACLNWILFGKKYHKFDSFCLSWMKTKSAADSESPNRGKGEWEGQRDSFCLIKITKKLFIPSLTFFKR